MGTRGCLGSLEIPACTCRSERNRALGDRCDPGSCQHCSQHVLMTPMGADRQITLYSVCSDHGHRVPNATWEVPEAQQKIKQSWA